MSEQDWTIPQNAPDWVGRVEKRLKSLERREGPVGSVLQVVGPAQNQRAILIKDWNDPLAANNGYFWSKPGALHAPDAIRTWTGSIIGRSDNSGMQECWNTDDLNDVLYYMRTFTDDGTGQGRTYSGWRSWATPSGLIELPDLGDTIDDLLADMAAEIDTKAVSLLFYQQATEPVPGSGGVPIAADIPIGSIWIDTDDDNHTYSWDGTDWVSVESTLFAAIEAELALQQTAIEAAQDDATDALGFVGLVNKTYRTSSAPANPDTDGRALVAQDTWFDTSTSLNEMKRWSGSAWVSADVGFTNADLATPTVTGGLVQTTAAAASGIKINSSGLGAWNGVGSPTVFIDAATGAIALVGTVTAGGTIDGAVVTGGTLQTEATASRGFKANSAGFVAYNNSGASVLTFASSTGNLTMDGTVAAIAVTGATVTGGTIQTIVTAARGVKITSAGLIGYDGSGVTKFTLDASTGVLTLDGGVLTGGSLTGGVVTGGTLQSEATAARGIKINSSGMVAYNSSGVAQVTIDAATGSVVLAGTMTGGGTITGPTFQTASSGERVIVRNDGSGGIIEFYSGVAGETNPTRIDPDNGGTSIPQAAFRSGTSSTYTESSYLRLAGGTSTFSEARVVAGFVYLETLGGGSLEVNKNGVTITPLHSGTPKPLTLNGSLVTINSIGAGAGMDSWQVACDTAATPNSTTNVTISGLSQSVTSPGTSAVYIVTLDIDIQITTANTVNVVELLVDGTAQTVQLVTFSNAGNAWRGCGSKTFRVTGLSAASHTFTARTRNTAALSGATIAATHTLMTIRRAA